MVSRATHYRNKARHDQREFGEVKPRLLNRDDSTAWRGAYIATLSNDMPAFNADSPIAAPLGATTEDRVVRLRELSKIGVLRMSAYRENGTFIEYRWTVTKGE